MVVQPIPHEQGRFFVASGSRPIEHVVDLAYQEEPRSKPKAECFCEAMQANKYTKGKPCKHIIAVMEFIKSYA